MWTSGGATLVWEGGWRGGAPHPRRTHKVIVGGLLRDLAHGLGRGLERVVAALDEAHVLVDSWGNVGSLLSTLDAGSGR